MRPIWFVLLLSFALGCGEQPAAAPAAPPERPPAPVVAATAEARDVPVYLDEIGRCVAREVVSVKSQVAGRVTTIFFTDGAMIQAGDKLYAIDERPFVAAHDVTRAAVAQARAAADYAKLQAVRYQTLAGSNGASRESADEKKSAAAVAEAQVQSALAAMEAARINVEFCLIKSPLSGRAGRRLVDVGNLVKANEDTLVVIERLDPIYAEFAVTEHELVAVRKNAQAGTLRAEVRLPEDEKPRVGELTFIDNEVDAATGTIKLRATLENKDRHFWPGQFVKVRLVLSVVKSAVLVPAAAVQVSAQGPFVYVIKADETAELRKVQPGQMHGTQIVLKDGVKAGERVVEIGHLAVSPGGKVAAQKK